MLGNRTGEVCIMTTNGHVHEVTFGKKRIPFSLEFRDRRRLGINVHPDRTVTVIAPHGRTVQEVVDRVQKRSAQKLQLAA